jgi:acetyl esterase/lipase
MAIGYLPRVVILALMLLVGAGLMNLTRLSFAALNALAYFGAYQHHASIPYASGDRHTLDVYAPKDARRRPVVVFWYGGMWIKGAKEWYRFVGAALANAGYVAVLPDYRLYPAARFPGFIEDGAQAVKWVREHAAEFGGDPETIFLMGHSAGAHLAATLALDPKYLEAAGDNARGIRGWISLSAPYALNSRYSHYQLMRSIFPTSEGAPDPQLIDRPLADIPPALLIHGISDIYPADAATMDRLLRSAGNHVECHIYGDVRHMDTVAAFSLPFRYYAPSLAVVSSFIDRTLSDPRISEGSISGTPCPALAINDRLGIAQLAAR